MTWFRMDDSFDEHHVIVGLSDAAFRVFVEGLCYCSRNLSDGLIPHPIAKRRWHPKAVAELVAAGRWESWPEGFYVMGYLDHQRSRQQIENDREGAARRTRKSRARNGVTHTDVRAPESESVTETENYTPKAPLAKHDPLAGVTLAKAALPKNGSRP